MHATPVRKSHYVHNNLSNAIMSPVHLLTATDSGAYSVVTDFARFRGKSTSTPFMMARSVISICMARSEEEHTVRKQLEGNDVDQTLQAVDSLGYSNDLGSIGNRVIVLVTDDD